MSFYSFISKEEVSKKQTIKKRSCSGKLNTTIYKRHRGDVMISPNMTSFIRTIAGRWFPFHRPANR